MRTASEAQYGPTESRKAKGLSVTPVEFLFASLPRDEIAARLWSHIDRAGETACWEWRGLKSGKSYGSILFRGHRVTAHRISYVLAYGPIPKGRIVCHHCDNSRCANPAHLYAGTLSDNMRDTVARGQHRSCSLPERTQCSRGHELTPENTRVERSGFRTCRTCYGAWRREWRRNRRINTTSRGDHALAS